MGSATPPNVGNDLHSVVLTLRITPAMKRQLALIAEQEHRSEASVVRQSVAKELLARHVDESLGQAA